MGKYRIVIEGNGPHSNGQAPTDADKVGGDTVATLQAMGHVITSARVQVLGDGTKAYSFTDAEILEDIELVAVAAEPTEEGPKGEAPAETGNSGGDLAVGIGTVADREERGDPSEG